MTITSNRSDTPEWLDTKGAAEYTQHSPKYLEKLRCVGGGPLFYKRAGGRAVRYKRTDLDAWLSGRGAITNTSQVNAA